MIHTNLDLTGYSKGPLWCGPSAVSLLTGAPIRETTEVLTRIKGGTYEELEGTHPEEVIFALAEYGYYCRKIDLIDRYPQLTAGPTIPRFMAERRGIELVMPLLVLLPTHWITAHFGMLFDNSTPKGAPVHLFPKPKRNVVAAWIVEKQP